MFKRKWISILSKACIYSYLAELNTYKDVKTKNERYANGTLMARKIEEAMKCHFSPNKLTNIEKIV